MHPFQAMDSLHTASEFDGSQSLIILVTEAVRIRLYWGESDITSKWVHRKSNLLFTLSSDKDQRKKIAFAFAFSQSK